MRALKADALWDRFFFFWEARDRKTAQSTLVTMTTGVHGNLAQRSGAVSFLVFSPKAQPLIQNQPSIRDGPSMIHHISKEFGIG